MITGPISEELIKAIEASWGPDSTYWGFDEPDNRSRGQCLVTAMVVQDYYGGKLIRGNCGIEPHYWNELPDGTEVDLTRQQFGGKEVIRDGVRPRKQFERNKNVFPRYEILRDRVHQNMPREKGRKEEK